MATSGTTGFNLDLNNLVEEAFERCGSQLRSGYDLRTARRSLNLLTIEWANRGINLWTIEQGQIEMVTGQGLYPIPTDTIDLLDHVVRQNNGVASNQIDINITRISESTYSTIPNKITTGRPIQVWLNRQSGETNSTTAQLTQNLSATDTTIYISDIRDLPSAGFINILSINPITFIASEETIGYMNIVSEPSISYPNGGKLVNCYRGQNGTVAVAHIISGSPPSISVKNLSCINVWPTPDAGGGPYTFVYWRMRRIQDAGNGATAQDIPFRLLPCMVAGLAFYMAQKLPDGQQRLPFLKAEYEEQWLLASTEDREKAASRFVPRTTFYV
jgi:hypothetical protein